MRYKKNAFTLIELLIVIVVVVMLSAMMIFAGGEAQAMAKATKIVNGLSDMKMSVLTWYRDNMDKINKEGKINGIDPKDFFTTAVIKKYINTAKDFAMGSAAGNYEIILTQNSKSKPTWYACYHLENKSDKNDIKEKLKDKAADKSVAQGELWQRPKNWEKYIDADEIYMQILVFNY